MASDSKFNIRYNEWNKWSEKSKDIPFKSHKKAIGDGEDKLAIEFDTIPLGQNSSYDLNLGNIKCEVKKLDGNSFNSGKDGRLAITSLKENITQVLVEAKNFIEKCVSFGLIDINLEKIIKTNIRSIKDVNEICESKCKKDGKLYCICKEIKLLRDTITTNIGDKNIGSFNVEGTPTKISSIDYYMRAKMDCISTEKIHEKLGDNYNKVKAVRKLSSKYFDDPDIMLEDFNKLSSIFTGVVLAFVMIKKDIISRMIHCQKFIFKE